MKPHYHRMMSHLLPVFIFIVSLAVSSCGFPEEPRDTVREINMTVSAETGITYHLFDDNREHPIECMLVKYGDKSTTWETLTFGSIEGFDYEKGHEYRLRVRQTKLANPPADASCYTYSLVRILSVTEP